LVVLLLRVSQDITGLPGHELSREVNYVF